MSAGCGCGLLASRFYLPHTVRDPATQKNFDHLLEEILQPEAERVDALEAFAAGPSFMLAKGEHVRVRRTTADTAFATGTSRIIPFNVEDYDVTSNGGNDQHDNSTNPSRLTCMRDGLYLVAVNLGLDANAGFGVVVGIIKNGSVTATGYEGNSSNNSGIAFSVSAIIPMVIGDFVEVRVTNGSGANRNVSVTTNMQPTFSMSRIGSTTGLD